MPIEVRHPRSGVTVSFPKLPSGWFGAAVDPDSSRAQLPGLIYSAAQGNMGQLYVQLSPANNKAAGDARTAFAACLVNDLPKDEPNLRAQAFNGELPVHVNGQSTNCPQAIIVLRDTDGFTGVYLQTVVPVTSLHHVIILWVSSRYPDGLAVPDVSLVEVPHPDQLDGAVREFRLQADDTVRSMQFRI